MGDLAHKVGNAITSTPYIGPALGSAGTALSAGLSYAQSVPGMETIAGIAIAAGLAKKFISAKVQQHLCKDHCAEKFVLDPEKRWRCQQACIKELAAFKKRDKYKHLRTHTDG